MTTKKLDDKDMNLLAHMEELRKRIIIVLVSFVIAVVAAFLYAPQMYNLLAKDAEGQLTVLGPTDLLWVYFVISGVLALGVTMPVIGLQIWQFTKPALSSEERKATLGYIPAIALLFAAGISFGYFVLFPMLFAFMKEMTQGQVIAMFTAERYFTFMLNLTLPFGLLFEMPVIVLFLTRLGIINPLRLAKARKLAYFCLVVLSISITPPDLVSDVLVTVPLLILYEVSITLSKIAYKKKMRLTAEL
ncbi:twin-arginine translocase subunit TatC [Paenibacillus agricola]|uniref:Sec-independent protein translocase protein TatC n=1 Tax=Paenibacillus agricola TaxID=2716264 RepID=A0ABX0J4V8_9BACL|nr:twin-arginine translocase subunit TatC [Paenibacillus agricola]NHN28860.1 twin-arginine translocase subunit TatC [Paenibacillus agricola]